MNKLILVAVAGLCFGNIYAKNPKKDKAEEGFVFTTVKENPITSIKNQNRSSTCWSFSSLGFLESELLREGKGEFDLSEMFVVHKTMEDRTDADQLEQFISRGFRKTKNSSIVIVSESPKDGGAMHYADRVKKEYCHALAASR